MKECPACGHTKLEMRVERRSYSVHFGPNAEFDEKVHACKQCSFEWGDADDTPVIEALARADKQAAVWIIARLEEQGISNAYLERACGLPQRTLARWKTGEVSAAAVALLRFLITFPWLLRVADGNYDPKLARKFVR